MPSIRSQAQPIVATVLALMTLGLADRAGAAHLGEFLPSGVQHDPAIPTPKSVLGYEVGEWHVRHDQLVQYMYALAEASPRVEIIETGRTYEHRPLLLLTISSPENLARIEDLRQQHLALSRPDQPMPDVGSMPVVVNLGYSVHGNESSGSNASMVVAYHLAAAQGPEIEALLRNTIVLIDPSLNPDGLARFSHWANMHRGKNLVGDPNSREHVEGWPSGRTNHYWFDLNRDWLPLQHPESRARIAQFHRWKPNVLADFHEMGSDETFFFQPGVPSRRNPLTPARNVELTAAIAQHHAKALDARRALYFSEEIFDDYYYGKGSTYPDVNGGVGILFEQASARGHKQDTDQGELDFAFTIKNQCTTSYSTLRGALEQRVALLRWQREFHAGALEDARKDRNAAIVFGAARDAGSTHALLQICLQHDIRVHALGERLTAGGNTFVPDSAYVVPLRQPQYRLIRALFDAPTAFPDSLFYDISAWTLPLAMHVPYAWVQRLPGGGSTEPVAPAPLPAARILGNDELPYAYAFRWDALYAPRALQRALRENVRARVATAPFRAQTAGGDVDFAPGTIVVTTGAQQASDHTLRLLMQKIAQQDAVDVHVIRSGLTPSGIDLGSPSLRLLRRPRPLLLTGRGVSAYEAGEAWHVLDQRMDIEVTLVDTDAVGRVELEPYTHVILVDGNYGALSDGFVAALKRWVEAGGVLVAQKDAARWARDKELVKARFADDDEKKDKEKKEKDKDSTDVKTSAERHDYADFERIENAQEISGAIFAGDVDTTHPLGFGFGNRRLALFRDSTLFMAPSENPYGTVVRYTEEPLLAGWISQRNLTKLRGSASVVTQRSGSGVVVLLADDPNFRAFWYGTSRLFLNALFFAPVIDRTKE
jgi:hypothetical protein